MNEGLQPTGLLIVRIWKESPADVRARITGVIDVGAETRRVTIARGVHGVEEAVRSWLEEFMSAAASSPGPEGRRDGPLTPP